MTNDLYKRLDVLLIGVLVGNEAVGFYETALRLAQPGAFFAASISDPLHVKASGLSSRDLDVIPDLKNAFAYCGLLTVPIFFGALAMPVEIVRTVFGAEFTPAWTALVGLTLFQLLNGYATPLESIVSGIDQVKSQFGISTLILIIHTPLAILLGLRFELIGVVGATIFGEVVRLTAYQYLSKRLLNTVVSPRPIATQLFAGSVMAVTVYTTVNFVISIKSWLWLIIVVGFGAAIYFGVLAAFSRHFRETIDSVVPVQLFHSR
jgi:O-antigen/teichoic acid export membrane protein